MYQKEVVVKSITGLHARPGAEVAKIALTSNSEVYIEFDGKKINAKEVLDILSANIEKDSLINIVANGTDEKEVVDSISEFVSRSN